MSRLSSGGIRLTQQEVPGEPRHVRQLIVTAILAVGFGVTMGFFAGYQTEKMRVQEERSVKPVASNPTGRFQRPVGAVEAVEAGTVTIRNLFGQPVQLKTSDATVVLKSDGGSQSDLVEGVTIMAIGETGPDGRIEAKEIIVLREGSNFFVG